MKNNTLTLLQYWQTRTPEAKRSFSRAIGVGYGALSVMINNPDTVYDEKRCLLIEESSNGRVTAESLNPRINWVYVRGDMDTKMAELEEIQAKLMGESCANG